MLKHTHTLYQVTLTSPRGKEIPGSKVLCACGSASFELCIIYDPEVMVILNCTECENTPVLEAQSAPQPEMETRDARH